MATDGKTQYTRPDSSSLYRETFVKSVASFEINYTRYLDPNGDLLQDLPSTVSSEIALHLYRTMVRLRAFDNKAIALQRTGQMGTYASTLGQEAISTAIGAAMLKEDVLAPFYRDYGAMIQRGVKMSDIYRYWGGDERGSDYQNNPHDFPICVPIASQCLHAAGAAYSFLYQKQARVAVTSIGDGGTSQGDFYEALNVAGAWNCPVVFVINNNQWAISVPLSKQTKAQTLAQKAIAAGIPGIQVDGNDALATYDVIKTAIENARSGNGPCLVEAMTYRLCDHTTADDASRYRPKEEVDAAWQAEPIARLKAYLLKQSLWSEEQEQSLQQEVAKEIETQVADYLATPKAPVTDMFDFTFAELPEGLILQRQQAIEENSHG